MARSLAPRRNSGRLTPLGDHHFVDKAVFPTFAGLEGLHDGVFGCVKVFACMPILGRVAAPHVSALQAFAQVHPRISALQAFLTPLRAGSHFTYMT